MEAAMAFFVDRWAGREGVWAAMPEKVRTVMKKGGARLRHEWFGGFYPRDQVAWLKELTGVPTLLVEGQATVSAAAQVCDRFAELRPGVMRLCIPGAGHMVPFTHAAEVAAPVEAHLGANSR
jgi:pimeloyl-ACP methyl ester carboxylesterase